MKSCVRKDQPVSSIQASTTGGVISPVKWVTMITECIDQLKKWHNLLEGGVISQSESSRQF